MELDRAPLEQRFKDLINDRQNWEPVWKDLQKYILPTRGLFDAPPNQDVTLNHKVLVDGEPSVCAATLAAGMHSGLTSPAMPWFALGVSDPELNEFQPVRVWLDKVREVLMAIFAKSNVYDALYGNYEELGTFATGCMGVFQDFDNVIRAHTFTCGEYYFAVDEQGRVDTFGRMFYQTTGNLIKKFGKENVSNTTRQNYEANRLYVPVKVYHLIEPNDGRDPRRKDNQNMPCRSTYWEEGQEDGRVLRVSGFQRFPILGPRWGARTTVESYGRGSPGWRALGDSKGLQAEVKDKLKAIARTADPPMQAPSRFKNEVINALPGGVTYGADSEQQIVRPLYAVNLNLEHISRDIFEMQVKINRYFYTDLFKMLQQRTGPQMTAREIVERHEEKMMVLSPILERIETELLDPLIELAFMHAQEAGMLPEPPSELEGMDLKVEYVSVLAQAQKMVGTTSIVEFAGLVGNIAAVQPDIMDKVNFDEMIEEYGDRLGVPPKIIRSEEETAEIRKQRAAQEQEAAAMEQAGQMVQGAKVLSETDTQGPNALTALLGGPGGGMR